MRNEKGQFMKGFGQSVKHGFSKNKHENSFYNRYCGMKGRCNNPKNHKYYTYGAKGIKCLWESFEDFRDDMHTSYLEHVKKFGIKNTSIDRIDVNGHYCKENCQWATIAEQARNKRTRVVFSYRGEERSLIEWAEILGIKRSTLCSRIYSYKWSIEKALTAKVK